jgi:hypothetical protein
MEVDTRNPNSHSDIPASDIRSIFTLSALWSVAIMERVCLFPLSNLYL